MIASDAARPRQLSDLAGITIAQWGNTPSAAIAGSALRLLGAEVTAYRPATQDPGRGSTSRLIDVMDRGKRIVPIGSGDPLEMLTRGFVPADITIVDIAGTGWPFGSQGIDAYAEVVDRLNQTAWVTLSPFGLEGPAAGAKGSELTYLAAGGVVATAPFGRAPGERPIKPAGHQASFVAGHLAAIGALYATRETRLRDTAVHVDLSAQEAVMSTGVALECAHLMFECEGGAGMFRYAPPRGIYPCRDGLLWITALDDHHWLGVRRALGEPGWAADIQTPAERFECGARIDEAVREWSSMLPATKAAALLQEHGVPAVPVHSCASLMDDPGIADRDFFRTVETGDTLPQIPVLDRNLEAPIKPAPFADRLIKPSPVILDLTHVLAGPLATAWLASMGFDVVKVEDEKRLDVYRRRGPFCDGRPGIERSAYFAAINYSKSSVALDLTTPSGQRELRETLGQVDLVIENLSSRRAEVLGLTPATFAGLPSDLLSSSGFGRDSSYSEYRAYGSNIHASGGLVWLSRTPDNEMFTIGTSWADPVASIWMAMVTLARSLGPQSGGAALDLSMTEAVAYQFTEYFSYLTRDNEVRVGGGNQMDGLAPCGIYRCRGQDSWLAIVIEDDQGFVSLREALGMPISLEAREFATHAARRSRHAQIDEALEAITSQMDREILAARLLARGIAAAPVMTPRDLVRDPHLNAREMFPSVSHPEWGSRPLIAPPWRIRGSGRGRVVRPRLLGEDGNSLIDYVRNRTATSNRQAGAASNGI